MSTGIQGKQQNMLMMEMILNITKKIRMLKFRKLSKFKKMKKWIHGLIKKKIKSRKQLKLMITNINKTCNLRVCPSQVKA